METRSHGAIRFQDVLTPGALKPLVAHLDFRFPRWCRVRQQIASPQIADVQDAVRHEMGKQAVRNAVKPGDRIAVAVGSRHFAHMPLIVRECVDALKAMGARPFIVPAMGSHGGATAEGQAETLAGRKSSCGTSRISPRGAFWARGAPTSSPAVSSKGRIFAPGT